MQQFEDTMDLSYKYIVEVEIVFALRSIVSYDIAVLS